MYTWLNSSKSFTNNTSLPWLHHLKHAMGSRHFGGSKSTARGAQIQIQYYFFNK